MTVFLLLVIFLLLGYLLAFTPLGDRIVAVADELTEQVRGSRRPAKTPAAAATDTREWLMTDTAVPDDLRLWYLGLTGPQARRFERALHAHCQNTGLLLASLVSGDLDRKPMLRNVYVEAVSIYSQAYRKAREAIALEEEADQPAEDPDRGEKPSRPASRVDGKKVAEKRPSRRKTNQTQTGSVPAA